jgi:hypothetical protein
VEPAFLKKRDVRAEIDRLSAKFGQRAREIWLPERDGLPRAVIAVWGKIDLEQLDPTAVANVASGGRERGLLVSFLGDLQRSAKAQVPIYRLSGGAGFLWAATFNQRGRGVLRFLTVDASQTEPKLHRIPRCHRNRRRLLVLLNPGLEISPIPKSAGGPSRIE